MNTIPCDLIANHPSASEMSTIFSSYKQSTTDVVRLDNSHSQMNTTLYDPIANQPVSEMSSEKEEYPIRLAKVVETYQNHRLSITEDQRLFNVVQRNTLHVAPVDTLSLCTWKNSYTTTLQKAVNLVLLANPVLTGRIVDGTHAVTGQKGLCVDLNCFSIKDIFQVVHGETFDISNDLKEMINTVKHKCLPLVPDLGNGYDQQRNSSPLFAVTVVLLPPSHAVVHISISHAIADGQTYYRIISQLNAAMKDDEIKVPLRWNEAVQFKDKSCTTWKSALIFMVSFIII